MIMDLTAMEVAGASLLDEATAAAEAMHMFAGLAERDDANLFFVSELCHPQTLAVVAHPRRGASASRSWWATTSASPLTTASSGPWCSTPPPTAAWSTTAPSANARTRPARAWPWRPTYSAWRCSCRPGEFGADVALGSTQRFGTPLGYGGPHAAFFATRKEFVRKMPGRLIGVSVDAHGRTALRMALQTREQHIRREKATSNICTSQVLLAVMASMYAVYHGPAGIRAIAERVARLTAVLAEGLARLGLRVWRGPFFDTVRVEGPAADVKTWHDRAEAAGMNFRPLGPAAITISLDETTSEADVTDILTVLAPAGHKLPDVVALAKGGRATHPRRALAQERVPATPGFFPVPFRDRDVALHPAAGGARSVAGALDDSARLVHHEAECHGRDVAHKLARMEPTAPLRAGQPSRGLPGRVPRAGTCPGRRSPAFDGVSLQPNAGSQGEYAGLLVIRRYHTRAAAKATATCA